MYFSLPSAAFKEMLALARAVIPSKTRLPVLSSLRFHVPPDGRTLEVSCTDLDITLTQTLPLPEPGGPGTAFIYLAGLSAVRADRNTPVRIDYAPHIKQFAPDAPACQILYVSGGHSATAELETHDGEEYPKLADLPGPEEYSCLLPAKTLAALTASIPFQSRDETRYVLNGAYLSAADGGAIVATDGRRMAIFKTKVTPASCILPRKTCQLLAKLKPATCAAAYRPFKEADPGRYNDTAATLHFRSPAFTLHTKLVEGNYPNYGQIIPQDTTSGITFADPSGIASWLASLPLSERSNTITLTPRAPHFVDLVHTHGRITATAYLQGEPPEIAFNPCFLADALAAVPGTLHLTDGESPGTLRQGANLVVLMSMRVYKPAAAEPATEEAAA